MVNPHIRPQYDLIFSHDYHQWGRDYYKVPYIKWTLPTFSDSENAVAKVSGF